MKVGDLSGLREKPFGDFYEEHKVTAMANGCLHLRSTGLVNVLVEESFVDDLEKMKIPTHVIQTAKNVPKHPNCFILNHTHVRRNCNGSHFLPKAYDPFGLMSKYEKYILFLANQF